MKLIIAENDWKWDIILRQPPDPGFRKSLKSIDRALDVRWGKETRFGGQRWIIIHWVPPEYWGNDWEKNRVVWVDGQCVDVLGPRPEYDYVMTVQDEDKSYRPLDQRALDQLISGGHRHRRFKNEREELEHRRRQKADLDAKKKADAQEGYRSLLRSHRRKIFGLPFSGQPRQVYEGNGVYRIL